MTESKRERVAGIIEAAFFHPSMNGRTGEERCLAAARALLSDPAFARAGEMRSVLRDLMGGDYDTYRLAVRRARALLDGER